MDHYTPDDIKDIHAISKRIEENVIFTIEHPKTPKFRLSKTSKGVTTIVLLIVVILLKSIGDTSNVPYERLHSANVVDYNFFEPAIHSNWQEFEEQNLALQPILSLEPNLISIDGLYIGIHAKAIPLILGSEYKVQPVANTENTFIYKFGHSIELYVFNDYVYKIMFNDVNAELLLSAYNSSSLFTYMMNNHYYIEDAHHQIAIEFEVNELGTANILLEKRNHPLEPVNYMK